MTTRSIIAEKYPAPTIAPNALVLVDNLTVPFRQLLEAADPILLKELQQAVCGPISCQDFATIYAAEHRRHFQTSILANIFETPAEESPEGEGDSGGGGANRPPALPAAGGETQEVERG